MKEDFESISITGRYIYGYLCLIIYLKEKSDIFLPSKLNVLIKEFVKKNDLEKWHEKAEEILPSFIFENEFKTGCYEFIDDEFYFELKRYYSSIDANSLGLIENLLLLGSSNLYGAFESDITMKYLLNIIEIIKNNKYNLPDINVVLGCLVTQKGGWGDIVKMEDFIEN